jgi:hydroxyethylthiazole kinase-like sugar kinase family protein
MPAAVTAYIFHQILLNLSVLWHSIASEFAAEKPGVPGPGTFLNAFVDEIHRLSAGGYEKGVVTVDSFMIIRNL